MDLEARQLMLRATLMLWKANRRRRRQLKAELATYTSPSDLNDLYAMLDNYPDGQTHEIREILSQQQTRRMWTANHAR